MLSQKAKVKLWHSNDEKNKEKSEAEDMEEDPLEYGHVPTARQSESGHSQADDASTAESESDQSKSVASTSESESGQSKTEDSSTDESESGQSITEEASTAESEPAKSKTEEAGTAESDAGQSKEAEASTAESVSGQSTADEVHRSYYGLIGTILGLTTSICFELYWPTT